MRGSPTVAWLLIPAVLAAAPQAPPPPPVPPPTLAAQAAAPPPRLTVALDLLSGTAEPTMVTAPLGQDFSPVVKNRLPYGSYRVTNDFIVDPDSPSQPGGGRLHHSADLQKAFEPQFRRVTLSPECDAFQDRIQEVLKAAQENELPGRMAAVHSAGQPCAKLVYLESALDRAVNSESYPSQTLYAGDELRYTVERLDPAGGAVLKTWRFIVRAEGVHLGWTYPNEEAWIVGETSRDLVEMILYARDRALPAPDALAFSVSAAPATGGTTAAPPLGVPLAYTVSFSPGRVAPQKQALRFDTYIWSPASYEPLAASLVTALGLKAAPPSEEGAIAAALVDPRSVVLAQESRRLSQRLDQAMLDAGAHEQAGLVLGTLALREAAGGFADTRPALCRMAAHLALARALRHGTASRTGALADALLLTLVARQRDALAAIDSLDRAGAGSAPAPAAFARALRIRNTRDWRILKDPGKATLLERLEHYRALQQCLGPSQALAFLETFRPEPLADWGLISLAGGVSVEQGHIVMGTLLPLELSEAEEVWKALRGTPLASDRLARELNARPSRLVAVGEAGRATPVVLGWGLWARFYQGNLCFAAEALSTFLQRGLSTPEDARVLREGFEKALSGVDLWPALSLNWAVTPLAPAPAARPVPANADPSVAVCARAVPLVQGAPELVPAHAWGIFIRLCAQARDTGSLPPMPRWFVRLAPAGTAMLQADRLMGLASPRSPDPRPVFAAVHEIAPFELVALAGLTPPGGAAVKDLAVLYGPLADYDLAVMRAMAQSLLLVDPPAVRAIYEKMAALEPESNLALGDYLFDAGLNDEAATAYEKAIEKSRDRVGVSNDMLWLVGYYCDRSRLDRAREVAQIAADVYSYDGLLTMGYFMERMGRYAEAETWYRKIIDRYGERSRGPLDDFYIRHEQRVGDGRFGVQASAALTRVFPAGLQKVSLAELTVPPSQGDGVRVTGRFQRSTRFGLLKDDIAVALNGYHVHNERQYQLLWTFDDRPEATVIVWRQGRYLEVHGRLDRIHYGPAARPI